MAVTTTPALRGALLAQGLATMRVDPVWDARLANYISWKARQHAQTKFGKAALAHSDRRIHEAECKAKYGPGFRTHPKVALGLETLDDEITAGFDALVKSHYEPFWRAAQDLAQTPAPTLAAAVFKALLIEEEELWNDSGVQPDAVDLIEEDFARLTPMSAPSDMQPVDLAPLDGRWILGYSTTLPDGFTTRPWVIVSRFDEGFSDAEGYRIELEGWQALPDPQPEKTSWTPPAGTVVVQHGRSDAICKIKSGGVQHGWSGWLVSIEAPDGAPGGREVMMFDREADADAKAAFYVEQYGLALRKNREEVPRVPLRVVPAVIP